MDSTLEAYIEDKRIFSSNRNWLHPIFDLEQLLEAMEYDRSTIEVYDRVVGRAAAFLFVNLGVKHVYADMLSKPGMDALESFGLPFDYNELVDRIECRTEEMLLDITDLKSGIATLREHVTESGSRPA